MTPELLGQWHTLSVLERTNITIDAADLQSGITNRGFTGHEQLDAVGLIHMNGRVYDAELGRFISADPHVQDSSNLQALNRYSYLQNNPLSYTDPSGYFLKNIFKKFVKSVKRRHAEVKSVGRAVGKILNEVPWLATVVGLVISVYCPPCGAAYFQYLALIQAGISYANGAPLGEVMKGYAVGMVTSYVTGGVSGGVGNLTGSALAGQAASVAMSGVIAKASGGNFADGVKSSLKSMAMRAAVTGVATAVKDAGVGVAESVGESKAGKTRSPAKDASGVNALSSEEANLLKAQTEFRRLYEAKKLPEKFNFIEEWEGGLDNEAFSFTFVNSRVPGRAAEMDIYGYSGATVFQGGASTFSDALDTVAHEIFHLDEYNQQLWKSGDSFNRVKAQRQAIRAGSEVIRIWESEK